MTIIIKDDAYYLKQVRELFRARTRSRQATKLYNKYKDHQDIKIFLHARQRMRDATKQEHDLLNSILG